MIVADFLGKKIQSTSSKLLFTNKIGGFFLYSTYSFTKYQGLFFNDKYLFKAIEEINIENKKELLQTKYNKQSFVNEYEDITEIYYFPEGENALIYELNNERNVSLVLDCRKIDDFSIWGRSYEISKDKGYIVIKYIKSKDGRESNNEEYEFYVVLKSDNAEFEKIDNWFEKNYSFDHSRKDSSSRYVYSALKLKTKKIGFGFSTSKKEAIKIADSAYKKQIPENKINKLPLKNANIDINYAYSLSLNAIESLKCSDKGIYAGLPWFHQFWTRDTAIGAKAYSLSDDSEYIKNILLSILNSSNKEGLLPNRYPESQLASIDSSGLVISRLNEIIPSLDKDEIKKLKEKVKQIALNMVTFRSKNNFIMSQPYESWMDTDIRSGALIEIQSLQLSIYKTLKKLSDLSKDKKTSELAYKLESELKEEVISQFFFNGDLYDSLSSNFRRPNVFLAYYFCPDLLSSKDWKQVFDKHLSSLYLGWGGLSTLDLSSPYFVSTHSGTDNLSYHKGDSWFFINNIAAICLHRLDKKKYKKYIDSILQASTTDILDKGIFGFHSELSSASHQEATGCLAQLWSSATYIELINEIF